MCTERNNPIYLGHELGVGHDPGQHAAYVKYWIKALKENPKEILRAARDAEQINRYVLALEKERALPDKDAASSELEQAAPEKAPQRSAGRAR